MKKTMMILAVSVCSNYAQADVIKCTFTEPFVSTTYSMTQSTLTYDSFEDSGDKVVKNVSFQIKGPGVFELVADYGKGKVLQVLTLNNQGSDGRSNKQYPYDVKDNDPMMTANNGSGGCTSNYQHSVEIPEEEQ